MSQWSRNMNICRFELWLFNYGAKGEECHYSVWMSEYYLWAKLANVKQLHGRTQSSNWIVATCNIETENFIKFLPVTLRRKTL